MASVPSLGILLAETVVNGRPKKMYPKGTFLPDDVTRKQSSRWQRAALGVPDKLFESELSRLRSEKKSLTTQWLLRLAKENNRETKKYHLALHFCRGTRIVGGFGVFSRFLRFRVSAKTAQPRCNCPFRPPRRSQESACFCPADAFQSTHALEMVHQGPHAASEMIVCVLRHPAKV